MIVYGRNPVREALRGPRTVHRAWAARRRAARAVAGRRGSARRRGLAPRSSSVSAARPTTRASAPMCRSSATPTRASCSRTPDALLVALDQVQDPQNLGAICRTAECAGASGVVIPERRAAEVTAAVCKASAGAVEHLPVARIRNVADFLAEAKAAGMWCYGAYVDGSIGYLGGRLGGPGRARAGLRGARPAAARGGARATPWSRFRCGGGSSRCRSARRRRCCCTRRRGGGGRFELTEQRRPAGGRKAAGGEGAAERAVRCAGGEGAHRGVRVRTGGEGAHRLGATTSQARRAFPVGVTLRSASDHNVTRAASRGDRVTVGTRQT